MKYAVAGGMTAGLLLASVALAATPTLSAFYVSGDSVQLNVTGDANQNVFLNYYNTSNIYSQTVIGMTNSGGSFSTTISTSQQGINPGSVISVTVNGQQSNSVQWPYTSGSGGSSSFTLNQSSVSLLSGQSVVVTASVAGPFYLASNSNPSVANFSIGGNQITVVGNTTGTTNASICLVSNNGSCASLAVTVNSSSAGSSIYFSQNNLSMPIGSSASVTVSGGSGTYNVVNNSNSLSVSASLSGSLISLYAQNVSGASAITVCSTNMSACGVLNVTVGGSSASSNNLIFMPSNPVIAVGQATTTAVIGGTLPYYVSSNSNSSAIQASVSNNIVTLIGQAAGTASITICSSNGGTCGTFYATVNAYASAINFSPASVTVAPGGSATVQLSSSGGSYYVSSNSASNIATAAVNGASVTITGSSIGSATIGICSNLGQCGTVPVTVSQTGATSAGSSVAITQVISAGAGINLMLSGGTAPYTPTAASGLVSATINSGTVLTLIGVTPGNTSVNVCAAQGGCLTIPVVVTAAVSTSQSSSGSAGSNAGGYVFTTFMSQGDRGAAITALQQELNRLGYLSASPTGYFGPETAAAVKAFQRANGISAVGYVGPSTRSALNSR